MQYMIRFATLWTFEPLVQQLRTRRKIRGITPGILELQIHHQYLVAAVCCRQAKILPF
jgi:hypothetical protein